MSAIAEILLTLGYRITGSDIEEDSRVRYLRRRGAEVEIGHGPDNVQDAEVVVKTAAVGESNPEIQEARRKGIPVIPRAEMLAELMRLQEGIAVAGTHGKTTTTAMVSEVLQSGGLDPTVVVGGRLHNLDIGARLGTDDLIVVEADESDGSFLKLSPVLGVVTNIEPEHMDYYGEEQSLLTAFREYINSVPFYGFMALYGDDPRIQSILPDIKKPFSTYGFKPRNDLRAVDCEMTDEGTRYTMVVEGKSLGEVCLGIPGEHNVLNSLGAAAVAFEQEFSFGDVRRGLEQFQGVIRRFDRQGSVGTLTVYDDYAHHPTEIEITLRTAKNRFDAEIIVIFQPHRYTRTRDLAEGFGPALKRADRLLVTNVYPAGEEPIEGIDMDFLKETIRPHRNGQVTAYESEDEQILNWVESQLNPQLDQVLFTMGAGDVVDLTEPILERERSRLRQK